MKLLAAAAALLLTGAPLASAPAPDSPTAPAAPAPDFADPMNVLREQPRCRSVLRQVQEQSKRPDIRRGEARTLDREPAAHLLFAVDRQVDGCREPTFVRRNIAPGASMPNAGQAPAD